MKADKKLTNRTVKYFAKMAAESYVNDPVHVYATKNENLRKRFLYHFLLERLATSNRQDDLIYVDEENRGICIFRRAHNDYTVFDFLLCPHWVFLYIYAVSTIKTLKFFSHLKPKKIFTKDTYLISPVFVDKAHQGKGIATRLINEGIEELTAKGYKIGLETQNSDNVPFYERLGFRTIEHIYCKGEGVHNYYMLYDENSR